MPQEMDDALAPIGLAALAAFVAVLGVLIVHQVLLRVGRRSQWATHLTVHLHRPAVVTAALAALRITLSSSAFPEPWRAPVLHGLTLALIVSCAWLAGSSLLVVEDSAIVRWRTDVPDNRQARRVRTQVQVMRRVTVAAVVVFAVGAMLMTFPAARAAGASLLASAGVAGIIIGLAAQSLLSNAFAGLQLAFSDALRLDDVVVVDGMWGRIEEITLGYVVVRIWDDRRLVLPSSYFTSQPYENWTRTGAALMGTVELDVDWRVPVGELRTALEKVAAATPLWDGRVAVLQVTEATGVMVRLRALVSAVDAPTLWDLRCHVREELVSWLVDQHPEALPRLRTEHGEPSLSRTVPAG